MEPKDIDTNSCDDGIGSLGGKPDYDEQSTTIMFLSLLQPGHSSQKHCLR